MTSRVLAKLSKAHQNVFLPRIFLEPGKHSGSSGQFVRAPPPTDKKLLGSIQCFAKKLTLSVTTYNAQRIYEIITYFQLHLDALRSAAVVQEEIHSQRADALFAFVPHRQLPDELLWTVRTWGLK